MEKKEFVETVKDLVKTRKVRGRHKNDADALVWMLCYFDAEQYEEVNSTKDWAEMLRDGLPGMNEKRAIAHLEDIFLGMDEDDIAAYFEAISEFWDGKDSTQQEE